MLVVISIAAISELGRILVSTRYPSAGWVQGKLSPSGQYQLLPHQSVSYPASATCTLCMQ